MALKVSAADGIKIYNLSSGKSLPEWVADRKKRQASDEGVELLQDFQFPSACRKIRITELGDALVAIGNYPPQVRIFDVANLSPKVTRHFDSDIIDFKILTEDFSKLAFVCADRSVKFHARFGHYHETRIPISGRAVDYVPFLAHLLIAGSSPAVHRLDLYEGRFLQPIQTSLESINAIDLSQAHGLIAAAGSDGCLECIDPRQCTSVGHLDAASALQRDGSEMTAVAFDHSGLHLAVGMSQGTTGLFDLRSQKPYVVKDHMYDAPIHSLYFLQSNGSNTDRVVSADRFVMKIWDMVSGETYTNIEPGQSAAMNHVSWWKDSGLFFAACDDAKIQSYFIPSLGTAPSWCSFLEGMTEELEEDAGHVLYDDYRFVTEDALNEVGLSHLIGTDLLKAYMHGYFVHNKLYTRAQLMKKPREQPSVTLPESRISSVKKVKNAASTGASFVHDERFKAIYENPEFRIDEHTAAHDDDSLLVPKATVETTLKTTDDVALSFEARTTRTKRSSKALQLSGPTEFTIVPKSNRKQHARRQAR